MNIPLVNLKAQYASLKDEVEPAIQQVLEKSDFILGEAVSRFEKRFADYIGGKYCVGVASGTDAIELALRAADIGPGDEVLLPANTFIATALAVSRVGAKPVLTDVDEESYHIDVNDLESRVTGASKAVIPVHLYGKAMALNRLMEVAEKHGLYVIEDACQAHGALHCNNRCGNFGMAGCFSFYPGKNLGAYGDGGAVVTSDDSIFELLKMLRNYGQKVKYQHLIKGGNSRLDTLQATVLNVKLSHIEEWNRARFENAVLYSKLLDGIEDLTLPVFDKESPGSHVFHLYVVRTKKRYELLDFMQSKNISCGIHYPVPIHLTEAYSELGAGMGSFPVAEMLSDQILSLPIYPELKFAEIEYVAEQIKDFLLKESN